MRKRLLSLRLYVAGNAPNSVLAIRNARAICDQHYAGAHVLEIVDLLERPREALADGIIVTPTLIKVSPRPVRKIIGSLSDPDQLLAVLGTV